MPFFIASQPSWEMTWDAFQRVRLFLATHLHCGFVKFHSYRNFIQQMKFTRFTKISFKSCFFPSFFPHLGLVSFPFKPYPISTALQTFSFYTSVTTILAVLALQSLLNGQFILWFFSHQLEYRFFFSTSLE